MKRVSQTITKQLLLFKIVLLMMICTLLLSSLAVAKDVYIMGTDVSFDNQGVLVLSESATPVTGNVINIDNDTGSNLEMTYKKGFLNGVTRYYYSSGHLKAEVRYKKGLLNGISRYYYKDGKLSSLVEYSKGELHGIKKIYYEDGTVKQDTMYNKGIKNGREMYYRKNGRLHYEIRNKDGAAVNASCVKGDSTRVAFTKAEMYNWNLGEEVVCDPF